MVTSNAFLYLTVLFSFNSAQGVFELPLDITAATELLSRVTGQIVAGNDSQLQEFADIFNYFVNLTQLENEGRNEVNRLTASNSTKGDDNDVAWETAVNDALDEENIKTKFQPLKEEVIEYIQTFVSKPENLKLTYIQSLPASRKDIEDGTDSDEEDANYNPFWDVSLTRRIFKGVRTKIKYVPFIASVQIFSKFACAGSIIKSDLVITAASCLQLAHNNRFFRENPAFLSVRVGSLFFSVGGDVVPVIEVYFHPTYEPSTLFNNLAIMRLRRLLSFRHKKVKKIDFDRSATALPENTPGITIVGWGATSESNKITAQMRLHAAELDYYDKQSCREIYGKKFVTKTNFCAGYITKGEGACNRDVGDPGVSGKYLLGITSFGSPNCGKVDTPTVFTKLGFYVDWIEEIMEQEVPRMSMSTTTKRPFHLYDKRPKLYGGERELDPIVPLLRELQGVETEPAQDTRPSDEEEVPAMIPNEPQHFKVHLNEGTGKDQNEEIDPNVDVDPEILANEPDTEKLPIQPPTIIETGNVLMDYGQSDGNSEEGSSMKPVEHVTSIIESTEQGKDVDVDNVARTLKPPEIINKMDAASMFDLADYPSIDDSTKRQVTSIDNVDPEETMFNFTPEIDVNATDTLATTRITENQDIWVDKKDYTALRNKIHHMSQEEVKKMPKQIEDQTEQTKNTISSYIGENSKSVEFEPDLIKVEDVDVNILDKHSSSENEEENQPDQLPSNFQEENTDALVKREIQELITQLEISSEITSATENTPLRNLVNDMAKDEAKTTETVLTFLYLTDNESQAHLRATLTSEEEGLSIDSAPFQRSMHMQQSNDFVGRSEIYEILAKVMDSVVNKTTR